MASSLLYLVGMTALLLSRQRTRIAAVLALSLTLTPRGLALTEKIVPHALRYEEAAMDGMSEREVATLKALLKRVYVNLENADRDGISRPAAKARPAKKRAARLVKSSA